MSTPVSADPARAQARIRLLGPVAVSYDGRAVRLGGNKQRIALARLALAEGGTVPAGTLIDDLWGRNPPDGARHAPQANTPRSRRSTRSASAATSSRSMRH